MKTTMAAIILCLALHHASAQPQVSVRVSANFSFNELHEYGEWVTVGGYGEVWRPYVSDEWRPFSYGRWVWSSDGWLWESDEPFGWIVCHYGNWYYDDDWGWVWIPGYDWSPARVEWHVTDNEIGWMPLLPPPLPGRRAHAHVHWAFCPIGVFGGVEVHNHIVYRQPAATVVVRKGPPKIEYVRSRAKVKVITVAPRKVTVKSNRRSFVRVESSGPPRPHVTVPVGPKYRKHHRRPGSAVTVETHVEPRPTGSVTVTRESPPPRVRSEPQRRPVQVESRQSRPGSPKVRVESRSDDDDEESERSGKVKVKVKVKEKH